jgi:hypothetical protein
VLDVQGVYRLRLTTVDDEGCEAPVPAIVEVSALASAP